MSKRTMRGSARTLGPFALRRNAENALKQGHTQVALEAARALYDTGSSAENREFLVRISLEVAERLLTGNHTAEAGSVAAKVWMHVETADEKSRLAEIMARSNHLSRAWLLAEQGEDPSLKLRILGHLADSAIRSKLTLSSGLPADFPAQKDTIVRAFAEMYAGQDEQARTTLQTIGLSSPFLEWKVLLRGFLAYYQNDDAKAVENWRRLNPLRVPAKLAAPFLQAIDATFGEAQPLEARAQLQEALDRVQGGGTVARLRTMRRYLADERSLSQAFRQAEPLVPRLKEEAPRLLPRLAACFFWAVIDRGNPEDVQRYLRVFGPPAEDPRMCRLEALALEGRGQFDDAHEAWQEYDKSVAAHASALPEGHADRLRALVWRHMGGNAERIPDDRMRRHMRNMPFGFFDDVPAPLKPGAEACFKRSLELSPDDLESHLLLVGHYDEAHQPGKAFTAAKRLLKKFPEHAATLELVGGICLKKGDYDEAAAYFLRAVQANPLDKRLRRNLSTAHAVGAEHHAAAKRFDKAREGFEAALALRDDADRFAILCHWAGCEFQAGNPNRAEELLKQARAAHGHPLAVAFAMLVYGIRLKFKKPLKDRFAGEFNELLGKPPDAASAAALAAQTANLRASGTKYTGQKTHEKKVLAYLEKAKQAPFTEVQLQTVCNALVELAAVKLLRGYFMLGQQRFPNNPQFYLAEVDYELSRPMYRVNPGRVRMMIDKIRALSTALPDPERVALLEQVKERLERLVASNPFGGLMGGFPGMTDFMEDDDFDDDGEDWEDDWAEDMF